MFLHIFWPLSYPFPTQKSKHEGFVKVKLRMRCLLTGILYQATLMDFSKVLTAQQFQFFIVSLSKVMLLYRFQPKTPLWAAIVAYWSVFQDKRGLIHLKEMWKLPTAHLPLILSHRGCCLTFRPQLKHHLQECPSKDDLEMFKYFSS